MPFPKMPGNSICTVKTLRLDGFLNTVGLDDLAVVNALAAKRPVDSIDVVRHTRTGVEREAPPSRSASPLSTFVADDASLSTTLVLIPRQRE